MILLFSIVNVTASLTVGIKTILGNPFIKLLDDEVDNLNLKIISSKTSKSLKHDQLSEIDHDLVRVTLNT